MWNFEQFKNNVAIIDEYGTDVSYEDLIEFGDKVASVFLREALCLLCVPTRLVLLQDMPHL